MREVVEIIIPNMAEYWLRDPALQVSERLRRTVRGFGAYEADHTVFWSTGPRILLLPDGVDLLWYADIHEAIGVEAPPFISPRPATGFLVGDLLRDSDAQLALRAAIGDRDVQLSMFGPTGEIYRLADVLRGWGSAVTVDCVDEKDYWSSLYLDNKISVVDIARDHPQVRIAPAITVSSAAELPGAVDRMLAEHGRIIARALHGFGGDGSAITSADPASLEKFWETVAGDEFFQYPVLVQKFIEQAPGVGCPAADFLVGDDGTETVVPCAIQVANERNNSSVRVGPGSLSPHWERQLDDLCQVLGEVHRDLGYRGWSCADCVAGADGKLYITEINARRTGSMHAGAFLRRIAPDHSLTSIVDFMVMLPPGATYEKHIRPVFEHLWRAGVRAYPTSLRGLDWPEPMMAVLAVAPTVAEAERIVADIEASWGDELDQAPVAG